MTFIELVERIADETRIPKGKVVAVLHAFERAVVTEVGLGFEVCLRGFGTFVPFATTPGKIFGGARTVLARRVIRFRESRRLNRWRNQ